MSRRSLLNTIYLECLAFAVTVLLVASDVEGRSEGYDQTRETGIAARVTLDRRSICYNNKKERVKCSKKNGIIAGSVVGAIFVLLGAVYLYVVWMDRRKKSPTTEENEPLSDGSKSASDCEKGFSMANKKNGGADDDVYLDKLERTSVSGTSSSSSDSPSYVRPPGFPQTGEPATDSGPIPSTRF